MKKDPDARVDSRPGLRSVLRRLVPPVYLDLEDARRTAVRTFGLALVIRLVLMPFTGHTGLLSAYHRSYALMDDFIPRLLVPHELIQTLLLMLCSLFLPLAEMIGWHGMQPASNDYWLESFAPHPLAFPTLFLFKLPYFIIDFAIALVVLRLFVDSPARGIKAASMWLLNPLTIFTFYVLGRHDVITIFFIALGLLWLKRGREVRSALSIGVAIWAHLYAALLLPFLMAVHPGSWKKKLAIFGAGIAPVTLYNVVTMLGSEAHRAPVLSMLGDSKPSSYLLGFSFDMGSRQELFMFPVVYALLLLLALAVPQREKLVVHFSEWAACSLLLLYATAFFRPHFITWSILFIVILRVVEKGTVLRNFHYLQILIFIPYTFYWGEPLFGWLFVPLAPEFFKSLDSPWELIESFGEPKILVNLARSMMSATCLFMVGWILFGRREGNAETA